MVQDGLLLLDQDLAPFWSHLGVGGPTTLLPFAFDCDCILLTGEISNIAEGCHVLFAQELALGFVDGGLFELVFEVFGRVGDHVAGAQLDLGSEVELPFLVGFDGWIVDGWGADCCYGLSQGCHRWEECWRSNEAR
jgi:hypothetical protein